MQILVNKSVIYPFSSGKTFLNPMYDTWLNGKVFVLSRTMPQSGSGGMSILVNISRKWRLFVLQNYRLDELSLMYPIDDG